MAVGDTLDIDENGAVEWHRIASGSTTGSGSSGSVDTGATATGLTATGSIPMLDPESRAIGPTSDDSTR
ncbi:MAG TPA: hypothetical protein PK765_00915 [bacterium]|nr:hypothetical protein [bacterium]